ncbi:MAG: ubiquinol-cytochrome c reductase iron-sulfur subunit [Alphaproteobacteria bacterium]|nr:ubiquinol-cytochrome c reductase iron-sulfur subunit [Alphaproteobacteria bacterium]NDC55835.1 ubiquinol-cytochrome c reductase iron-sulfur subunit [Alphaproteobacteria bacterium]NDG03994.1 ubiquinol-cytochrome c reductase iron-sulfur subunit [Alphaproteobacteria bacterium]
MSSTTPSDPSKRDFIVLTGQAMMGISGALFAWPLVHSMNPSADVLALSTTEVNLEPITQGQAITVTWRGKPIFIRHRTAAEVESARADDGADLRDKQTDAARVKSFEDKEQSQWLVVQGVCTHLGCVPLGQKPTDMKGEFKGWFCPCHGSHYDTSGRIRKGPAPKNLAVPPYQFVSATRIKIG